MAQIIDVNCHFLPPEFYEMAERLCPPLPHMLDRARRITAMVDVETRCRLIDEVEGYCQIPSLASPPVESYAGERISPKLARKANQELHRLCLTYPDRFPSFVATLPLNCVAESLKEAERAVKELGAAGFQLFTNVNGRPLDSPEFRELFALACELDRPVWLHPWRGSAHPDYQVETSSKYEIWWALGWPCETASALMRLALGGVLRRFPTLKLIAHHAGGVLPVLEGRLDVGMRNLGNRMPVEEEERPELPEAESLVMALKRVYVDTASFGSAITIQCGLSFFGQEKVLFATDMPFSGDPASCVRATVKAIEQLNLPPEEHEMILSGNARKLLGSKNALPSM